MSRESPKSVTLHMIRPEVSWGRSVSSTFGLFKSAHNHHGYHRMIFTSKLQAFEASKKALNFFDGIRIQSCHGQCHGPLCSTGWSTAKVWRYFTPSATSSAACRTSERFGSLRHTKSTPLFETPEKQKRTPLFFCAREVTKKTVTCNCTSRHWGKTLRGKSAPVLDV